MATGGGAYGQLRLRRILDWDGGAMPMDGLDKLINGCQLVGLNAAGIDEFRRRTWGRRQWVFLISVSGFLELPDLIAGSDDICVLPVIAAAASSLAGESRCNRYPPDAEPNRSGRPTTVVLFFCADRHTQPLKQPWPMQCMQALYLFMSLSMEGSFSFLSAEAIKESPALSCDGRNNSIELSISESLHAPLPGIAKTVIAPFFFLSDQRMLDLHAADLSRAKTEVPRDFSDEAKASGKTPAEVHAMGDEIGIVVKECHNEDAQCAFVVDKIFETASDRLATKCSFRNIAILYRRLVSGKAFQASFRSRKIPFNVHGVAFYRKKVVKAIMAMLRTSLPGCDDGPFRQAFKVLLPCEKEERKKVIEYVDKIATSRKCSFISAACDIFGAKISGTLKSQNCATFFINSSKAASLILPLENSPPDPAILVLDPAVNRQFQPALPPPSLQLHATASFELWIPFFVIENSQPTI
ncbi:hypothetical protein ACLOJK_030473 [Asimina triloba]